MLKMFSFTTYAGAIAVATMALITGIDIVGRYFFNSPLPGAFDFTGNLLAVVSACGFITATVTKNHISVDSFYALLNKRYRLILDIFAHTLQIIVFFLFAWQCFVAFYGSIVPNLELTPGTPAIVTFPFHLSLALSFTICFMASIWIIFRLKSSTRDEGDSDNKQQELF